MSIAFLMLQTGSGCFWLPGRDRESSCANLSRPDRFNLIIIIIMSIICMLISISKHCIAKFYIFWVRMAPVKQSSGTYRSDGSIIVVSDLSGLHLHVTHRTVRWNPSDSSVGHSHARCPTLANPSPTCQHTWHPFTN